MKHLTRHKPSGTRAERSIFGTIFNAMVSVLLVEVALLVASIYVMRVGPQLDQNAEDILAMQVENRSRYIQTILNDAQELSTLESEINALTQELLDSGRIDLATLDSSSITAYPLLEAATPKLIAALRNRPVTGIFLVLNTHDLNERSAGKHLPSIYLRDLDPDASPSENNSDLLFERAPAQLVQEQSIATDKSWSPALTYQANARGYLYAPFQAAYDDGAQLSPADYGHWTITPYALKGDDRQAIYYSQPLILPDGTVYGVIGVELLTSYLAEKLPCAELQGDGSGLYLLACSNAPLNLDTPLAGSCTGPVQRQFGVCQRHHRCGIPARHRLLPSGAGPCALHSLRDAAESLQPERPLLRGSLVSGGHGAHGQPLGLLQPGAAAALPHRAAHPHRRLSGELSGQ